MKSLLAYVALLASTANAAPTAPGWSFELLEQNSGIVVLESIIVSPTLALFFDRASDDPLQINGHSAWGALFNLQTHEVTALDVITNSWCAGGALLSNGTMVSSIQLRADLLRSDLTVIVLRLASAVIKVASSTTPQ